MTEQQKKDYNRGWRASARGGSSREWQSGSAADAFEAGYIDYATGSPKWTRADTVKEAS